MAKKISRASREKLDNVSCTCKSDKTTPPPGGMFKANATDCICQLNKNSKSVNVNVKRATIAIG